MKTGASFDALAREIYVRQWKANIRNEFDWHTVLYELTADNILRTQGGNINRINGGETIIVRDRYTEGIDATFEQQLLRTRGETWYQKRIEPIFASQAPQGVADTTTPLLVFFSSGLLSGKNRDKRLTSMSLAQLEAARVTGTPLGPETIAVIGEGREAAVFTTSRVTARVNLEKLELMDDRVQSFLFDMIPAIRRGEFTLKTALEKPKVYDPSFKQYLKLAVQIVTIKIDEILAFFRNVVQKAIGSAA